MYLPNAAIDIIKIFTLGAISFIAAFLLTPILTRFLYKHKLWRKEVRTKSLDGKELAVFKQFHAEGETNVPRVGGVLIWGTVLIVSLFFFILSNITDIWWLSKLNFLSRNQTWLPLFTLIAASLLGLTDDLLQIFGKDKQTKGLSVTKRLILVAAIGLIGALWFYFKLDWHTLHIPGWGNLMIDGLYIPLFVIVMLVIYAGGVIDGIDGLAGGTFISIFGAYTAIALVLGQVDIAAFSSVILGALLAFLWFNIPPARFYMGETGIIGLCTVLTVIAFLTDSVFVLPIIAILLIVEAASVVLQLLSKKFRGKKIFLASPIHHHLEAKGWPHYQITMRFWIIGVVAALVGVAIRLMG